MIVPALALVSRLLSPKAIGFGRESFALFLSPLRINLGLGTDGGGDQADPQSRAAASPRTIPYPLDRSQSDVTSDGMANGASSLNGHHIPDCLQRRR